MITRSRAAEAARRNEEPSREDHQIDNGLIIDLTMKKSKVNRRADEAKLMEENKAESILKPHLKRDKGNIALLVFLYVLQGIPLGLAGAMPLLLQTKSVAYKDQAKFSLVFWPFSIKLLWAPIVDTAYFSSFGRRKTWLVPVQYLIGIFMLVLSRVSIGFAATDSVTGLKMIEAGVPKENLALLAIPMVPIQILLPVYISRYTAGPRPLDVFIKSMPYRLFMGVVFVLCVWWTNIVRSPGQEAFPIYFYATILLVYAVHQVTLYCMFVSIMAFHSRISDPRVGGTYLTLLNTVTNFGGNWCQTLALWMVDGLTWTTCVGGICNTALYHCIEGDLSWHEGNMHWNPACSDAGGVCKTLVDGYHVESLICVVLGFLWLQWKGQKTRSLQDLPESVWKYQ
ncbi:PREDICTED: acetyl-coenzyme A transporter 1-like [Acropora digitifera]|uniref:acetyl-coenzyme A transporter 1-like n=1 Tax=Acropora digitifera TaxID=70779 RepID=UPI00077AA89D|nr:PREDICTED: acetyl-coenzyme A transporter 1-like [Acropora digitifera]